MIVALIAVFALLPATFASNAVAQTPSAAPTMVEIPDQSNRLLAAGAGAILGILFFNIVTNPFGTIPWATAPLVAAPKDLARVDFGRYRCDPCPLPVPLHELINLLDHS